MYVHTHLCMDTHVYICTHVHTHTSTYTQTCMQSLLQHLHVLAHICEIYIHTDTHIHAPACSSCSSASLFSHSLWKAAWSSSSLLYTLCMCVRLRVSGGIQHVIITCTYTLMQTYTHIYEHTYTHAHKYIYTHTCILHTHLEGLECRLERVELWLKPLELCVCLCVCVCMRVWTHIMW
jgi:hypothetical protein